MGRSWRSVQHHQIARRCDVGHPIGQHTPQTLQRRDAAGRLLWDGVHGSIAGNPDFHRSQLVEIARHRGACGADTSGLQEINHLLLAGDRMLKQQTDDQMLAAGLAHRRWAHSSNHSSRPRVACSLLLA